MQKVTFLFSLMLFTLLLGVNPSAQAQTVSITNSQISNLSGGCDAACSNQSGFEGTSQAIRGVNNQAYKLVFSSPVTEIFLPYAGMLAQPASGGLSQSLGTVTFSVNGGGQLSFITDCNYTVNGGTVTATLNNYVTQGCGQTYRYGNWLITSSQPFTELTISNYSAFRVPSAAFLNGFSNFIQSAPSDSDGDGVIDADDNCPGTPNGTIVDAQGCPDTDNDGVSGSADPDGSDPCVPNATSLACTCAGAINTVAGTYSTDTGVGGNATAAGGAPDGTFTGNLAGTDNLTLTYPAAPVGSEITVTVGFNNAGGTVNLDLNGTSTSFSNASGNTTYAGQSFTLVTTTAGPHTLVITETGAGNIQVDGSVLRECTSNDADGDGVVDANDNCPGTPSGTIVDAQGCPDTDGDGTVGVADPDGSDPCNPNPNDPACTGGGCNAGSVAPQFGN